MNEDVMNQPFLILKDLLKDDILNDFLKYGLQILNDPLCLDIFQSATLRNVVLMHRLQSNGVHRLWCKYGLRIGLGPVVINFTLMH